MKAPVSTGRVAFLFFSSAAHLREFRSVMICFSVTNHTSALITPMAVSVCIDVQVKGTPTRASCSGTDGMEQTWYGEASHMVSERSLLF